jgi:hypothetical protein
VSVLVAELLPGVTDLEEKLQIEREGKLPQFSFTASENGPPTEDTVKL